MHAPRTLIAVLAAGLVAAGCSGSDGASSASQRSPAASPAGSSAPSASPSPTSAFCLDLSTFQVGLLSYRADAGKALRGEALDFKELRRKATLVQGMGKRMESSVPPDIEKHFRTVLKAVKESSGELKEGATVRDVLDPLYGEKNSPAFEAMNTYECEPGS